MDSPKQQIADRIKQANNILVTVSANPSVDQLAACIGLTLALNKLGKHATAVFSGTVPSTIEFLQPEKTLEKNTDSLRDFIIALDKAKADKLRYKVEDKVVKIFITPYRTSIGESDLNFSQGDFNVDVVLALGVHNQTDLDQAITAHGRILHDATVVTINVKPGGEIGALNWLEVGASSLSELGVVLTDVVDRQLIDAQIATAFLTGIVAETDRFSNAKTSPQTMSISAELMAAGANQQLVASKLQEQLAPVAPRLEGEITPQPLPATKSDDGTLEITHEKQAAAPAPIEPAQPPEPPQIHIDEHGSLDLGQKLLGPEPMIMGQSRSENAGGASDSGQAASSFDEELPSGAPRTIEPPHMMMEPPTLSGQLTANVDPEFNTNGVVNPLEPPHEDLPLLHHDSPADALPPNQSGSPVGQTIMPPADNNDADALMPQSTEPVAPSVDTSLPPQSLPAPSFDPVSTNPSSMPEPPVDTTPPSDATNPFETLSQLEQEVHSPHIDQPLSSEPTPTPSIGISPDGQIQSQLPPLAAMPTPQPVEPPAPDTTTPSVTPYDAAGDLANARDAVMQAIGNEPAPVVAPAALNALPLGSGPLHVSENGDASSFNPALQAATAAPADFDLGKVTDSLQSVNLANPPSQTNDTQPQDPNAPPPVPPPMMPPAYPTQ